MLFSAYIQGTPAENVSCRVFSPSRRAWWSGKDGSGNDLGWGTEAQATLQPLPSVGTNTKAGDIEHPEYNVVIEYMLVGDPAPIGSDPVAAPPQASGVTAEDVTGIVATAVAPIKQQTDKLLFNGAGEVAAAATLALTETDKSDIITGIKNGTDPLARHLRTHGGKLRKWGGKLRVR